MVEGSSSSETTESSRCCVQERLTTNLLALANELEAAANAVSLLRSQKVEEKIRRKQDRRKAKPTRPARLGLAAKTTTVINELNQSANKIVTKTKPYMRHKRREDKHHKTATRNDVTGNQANNSKEHTSSSSQNERRSHPQRSTAEEVQGFKGNTEQQHLTSNQHDKHTQPNHVCLTQIHTTCAHPNKIAPIETRPDSENCQHTSIRDIERKQRRHSKRRNAHHNSTNNYPDDTERCENAKEKKVVQSGHRPTSATATVAKSDRISPVLLTHVNLTPAISPSVVLSDPIPPSSSSRRQRRSFQRVARRQQRPRSAAPRRTSSTTTINHRPFIASRRRAASINVVDIADNTYEHVPSTIGPGTQWDMGASLYALVTPFDLLAAQGLAFEHSDAVPYPQRFQSRNHVFESDNQGTQPPSQLRQSPRLTRGVSNNSGDGMSILNTSQQQQNTPSISDLYLGSLIQRHAPRLGSAIRTGDETREGRRRSSTRQPRYMNLQEWGVYLRQSIRYSRDQSERHLQMASLASLDLAGMSISANISAPKAVDMPSFECKTGDEMERCCICLEAGQVGERISVLACTHTFHHTCISTWLGYSGYCPLCKNIVEL